ncbi:Zn-dependent hydrolase [Silanimonas sp.]|uniref:Zn-dependent hydrolase n=1 Tax=Silanimonas sp. TaxID=1929290 RepID=UPI0022BBDE53|nr:Zn-dependent hydrolase [Silanimonas sp.]MCZ8116326.1 Zn-dependent hydrolase [Silanimonas sp.]
MRRVDTARLGQTLETFAQIGATGRGGCDRQALTDADRTARDLLSRYGKEAGCTVEVDEIGNVFLRRAGTTDGAPVLVGSHLDTQATGGRFDGVYGVLAGLEVVRTLNDLGIITSRPIEVVDWTNEEGCRFAPAMLGSGVVSGQYPLAFALAQSDASGRTVADELDRIGYRGTRRAAVRKVHAAFEAHIEQGPILERANATVGVVTGIQGAQWFDVHLTGQSCHAGPTPMELRRDPWRAATGVIEAAYAIANRYSPWARCTIGTVACKPGARNTVPAELTFSVDLRHPDAAVLEAMVAALYAVVTAECEAHHLEGRVIPVWSMPPTAFDPQLVQLIERSAATLGYASLRLVSGAGHDSLHVAQYAPTAMIFVPCAGGLSHNELESARLDDLAAGANVLLHAVLESAGTRR